MFSQTLYAAFGVIGPISLAHIHPMVFACGRVFLIGSTSVLLALVVESHSCLMACLPFKRTKVAEKSNGGDDGADDNDNGNVQKNEEFVVEDRECLWPFSLIRLPGWQDGLMLFLTGSFMAFAVFSYIMAVKLAPYTVVAILQPTMSAFACVLSILLRREGFSLGKLFGVLLAVCGSIATLLTISFVGKKNEHQNEYTTFGTIMGGVLELANSIVVAMYLVTQKTLLNRGMSPVNFVAWTFTIAFGISMCVSAYFFKLVAFSAVPLEAYLGLLYGGLVIGTLAFAINSFAAKHTTPTIVSIHNTTAPVYSAIFLYIFRGEVTTPWAIPGAIAIGIGVVVVTYAKHRENVREATSLKEEQDKRTNESSSLLGSSHPSYQAPTTPLTINTDVEQRSDIP